MALLEDSGYFFDTELLMVAKRPSFRTLQVPVRWVDDRASCVRTARMGREDVEDLRRFRRSVAAPTVDDTRMTDEAASKTTAEAFEPQQQSESDISAWGGVSADSTDTRRL